MITMESKVAIIPNRWAGHRVDVCMVIRDSTIRFVARDVLEAVGVTPEGELGNDPGHRSGATLEEHARSIAWTRNEVGQVLNDTATRGDPTSGYQPFLRWLDDWIRDIEQRGIDRVVSMSTRATPAIAVTVDAPRAPEWYSIEDAARILSTDPGIELTRNSLFQNLEQRGWITRNADLWTPARDLLVVGFLTVRDVRIPGGGAQLYPQICLTPLGLTKLHKFLGGTSPLTLTPTGVPA